MTGKRVLYQEPQATFFHDVMTNLFTDKITKAATYYNLHPSNSELMSWGNNAPKIKDLLQLSGVTDTYVTFEYLVPYNMKRIDCILYGRNSQNQGNVVHIELKQWDNKGVRDADCEGNFNVDEDSDTTFQVQAYTGGGHRLVSHPSQQVRGYNDYLTGFIEILSSKELHIEGLAYCYNYRKNKTPNTLFDEKYSELLQAYKTYAGDEVQELAQHLQQALGNGDGETIFHKMINSPIRPSKKLLESAANLIHEGNVSAFALIEEQIIARNVILDKIRKIGNKKSIIIVKGGPGTGKTVIALHILALLAGNKKSYNIRYATKSKPLLEGVKDRLPRGSKAKLLFSNVTQFIPANCEPNNIDVLLVDEAHRISNSANNQYTPTDKRTNLTQIQTIVQAAKISVFFIDDKQAIRSVEIGSSQLIRECAKEYNADIAEVELKSQFRCNGSDNYLDWLEQVIYGKFDAIAHLRLHPNRILLRYYLADIGMFFQQKLIFQIFQFLHFLQNTVLIINQIQVMYDLFLYFNQIMIRIIQLQFHVAHHIPHLYIHRHPEKSRLSVVYQFFALANQQGDIIPFLVQPKKFGLFDPASDGLESAITNYNHSEQSRCISATFLF